MPNWCQNDIYITGKDVNVFRKFLKGVFDKREEHNIKNDFDMNNEIWLKHIPLECGMTVEEANEAYAKREMNVRGWFYLYEDYGEDEIFIDAYSAWLPCINVFSYAIKFLNLNVEMKYCCIDEGYLFIKTNDKDLVCGGDYYVECFDTVNDSEMIMLSPEIQVLQESFDVEEHFWSEKDLREAIEKSFPYLKGKSTEELIHEVHELTDNIFIQEIEFVEDFD